MPAMITGMWSGITFYCNNHPDEKLVLKQGAYSAYYGCVHEYDENQPCHNRLNLIDADKVVQHLIDKVSKAEFAYKIENLTNYKWHKNGITFTVLKHNPQKDTFSILVDNKKIMI